MKYTRFQTQEFWNTLLLPYRRIEKHNLLAQCDITRFLFRKKKQNKKKTCRFCRRNLSAIKQRQQWKLLRSRGVICSPHSQHSLKGSLLLLVSFIWSIQDPLFVGLKTARFSLLYWQNQLVSSKYPGHQGLKVGDILYYTTLQGQR